MHRFRLLASEVLATQADDAGHVMVNGAAMVCDSKQWVVIHHSGEVSTWSDAEFREAFEPVDAAAARYLDEANRPA